MHHEEKSNWNTGAVILSFLAGAAVGATLVALTTPKSGPEVRNQVSSLVHEGRESVSLLPSAVREATEAARKAFNEALNEQMKHSELVEHTESAPS